MQHSQTERLKTLNQSESAIKIPGCSGAFTYITAQIVKERSVLTSSEKIGVRDEFPESCSSENLRQRKFVSDPNFLASELVEPAGIEPATPSLQS